MLQSFAVLLVCQLFGEGLARGLSLPVPGPVIGLMLLALGLVAARRAGWWPAGALAQSPLGQTADGLLRHLSLLFVPAGVGIVQQAHTLIESGPAIVVALVGSTLITLVVSVLVFLGVTRLLAGRPGGHAR